jgi:hypothetical protein
MRPVATFRSNHRHPGIMSRLDLGLAYALVTGALLLSMWHASQYFGTERYFRLWAVSGILLGVSQIVFFAIAARIEVHTAAAAGGRGSAGHCRLVYLLAVMPS